MSGSRPEALCAGILDQLGVDYEREHQPFEDRKNRIDFALTGARLAIEVEGGKWVQGRHQRPEGFEKDMEKYNRLALEGWCVLRFTMDMLQDGRALTTLNEAFRRAEAAGCSIIKGNVVTA